MKKFLYLYVSFLVLGLSLFFIINSVFAWSLPTANPPQGDLPAPLDTSSVEQTKVGNLNLDNNLKVGGLLRLGLYTSHPTGTNGNLYYNTSDHKFYGYQNNEWKELGGGAGFWLASGDDIYNTNTGNVGIGTTSPGQKLDVSGGNIRTTGQLISTVASGTAPLSVSSNTKVANLNADLLDGYSAGNASGNIPLSNGTANTNLNADMIDGQHYSSAWPNPSNMVTGSGTSNYLSKWTGTYTQGNSLIYDNGTNVGIGTTSPSQKLHVAGSTQIDGAIVAPEGTLRDDGGGWIRTYGNTGWYSQTYGGGWYMTDSTYLRAYNNKQILAGGGINMNSTKITNLATPTAASDAATKGYVDATSPTLTCTLASCSPTVQGSSTGSCNATCPSGNVILGHYWNAPSYCDAKNIYPNSVEQLRFTFGNSSGGTCTPTGYIICCTIM